MVLVHTSFMKFCSMMLVKKCLNEVDKYELISIRNDFVGFLALLDRLKKRRANLDTEWNSRENYFKSIWKRFYLVLTALGMLHFQFDGRTSYGILSSHRVDEECCQTKHSCLTAMWKKVWRKRLRLSQARLGQARLLQFGFFPSSQLLLYLSFLMR